MPNIIKINAVSSSYGQSLIFIIRGDMELQKLKEKYCLRNGVTGVYFSYKDKLISDYDTAEQLGMKDGDTIKVY